MAIKTVVRSSYNWMHLKDDTTALLQNINIYITVIYTTLSFLSFAFVSNFFPEELFTRTPLKLFSCSLLLAFTSGLTCHKESASASIHESYTKWAREIPVFLASGS